VVPEQSNDHATGLPLRTRNRRPHDFHSIPEISMRFPAIPLTLLATVLVACSDELPTAVAADGFEAAQAAVVPPQVLPFKGTLDAASHTSAYDPQTNAVLIHEVGTGTATYLGRYTLVSDYALNAATLWGSVSMTFTAANGDLLFATGTAQGTPQQDGSIHSHEDLTITGGTGRFEGATGSFVLMQVDLAPNLFSSGPLDGSISFGG
jgi:hypothetical protein